MRLDGAQLAEARLDQLDVKLGLFLSRRSVATGSMDRDQTIVINLSGRGDKDMATVAKVSGESME